MQNVFHRENCRLCNHKDLELVLPIRPSPIADDYVTEDRLEEDQEYYPLDLYLCQNCGHLQHLDVVDPDILFRNYTYVTSSSLGLVDHYRQYADAIVDAYDFPENSLVVEVGSNDGSLLNFFKQKDMRVVGVDPARNIAEHATKKGIPTIPDFFNEQLASEIIAEYGKAKIVTANNVFAHSDNLLGIVNGIRELLDDDGIFVFEVSYLLDIIDNFLFDTVYHEHVSYHTVGPLDKMFTSLGMELFDIHRIKTKGGSMRCFVQLDKQGKRQKESVVDEMLNKEKERNLDGNEIYKDYYQEIEKKKDALSAKLDELKNNGCRIIGYGASTTVTTLMNHFLIDKYLDYVVDDNPVKQGKYTPGSHIPVYPSEHLYEDTPDYIVILAWQYKDPIMKKHTRFMQNGGKFIIPLPVMELV